MDTDEGARALAEAAGEGPAVALVNDLRYRRAVEAAKVTVRNPPVSSFGMWTSSVLTSVQ